MTSTKITHDKKLPEASDAGQKPPTESSPVRQRYQMGCHVEGSGAGDGIKSRSKPRSRQFNRGSGY